MLTDSPRFIELGDYHRLCVFPVRIRIESSEIEVLMFLVIEHEKDDPSQWTLWADECVVIPTSGAIKDYRVRCGLVTGHLNFIPCPKEIHDTQGASRGPVLVMYSTNTGTKLWWPNYHMEKKELTIDITTNIPSPKHVRIIKPISRCSSDKHQRLVSYAFGCSEGSKQHIIQFTDVDLSDRGSADSLGMTRIDDLEGTLIPPMISEMYPVSECDMYNHKVVLYPVHLNGVPPVKVDDLQMQKDPSSGGEYWSLCDAQKDVHRFVRNLLHKGVDLRTITYNQNGGVSVNAHSLFFSHFRIMEIQARLSMILCAISEHIHTVVPAVYRDEVAVLTRVFLNYDPKTTTMRLVHDFSLKILDNLDRSGKMNPKWFAWWEKLDLSSSKEEYPNILFDKECISLMEFDLSALE